MRDLTAETLEPGDSVCVYVPDRFGCGEIVRTAVAWVQVSDLQPTFIHCTNDKSYAAKHVYLTFTEADKRREFLLKESFVEATRIVTRIKEFAKKQEIPI